MKRPETNEKKELSNPRPGTTGRVSGMLRLFTRDEDGAMIIFGLMIFGLMLAIGGLSFDLMRYEAHRERLQSTLDRAVLAAASLTQTLDPKQVVLDYFAKAGMSDFIGPEDITVIQGISSRTVSATARINVPLHHGVLSAFTGTAGGSSTLVAEGNSTAQESIGNVEISMVLDVSGSMRSYSRLTNLKIAAKDFLDTVYDAAEPGAVSTSIIPYATQVNAGATLLSYFTRNGDHDMSHCVNFSSSDFNATALSTTTALDQTAPFDPWADERNTYGYAAGERPPNPVCAPVVAQPGTSNPSEADRAIIPWSVNKAALKTYIDNLVADGNTSTDVGVKWGAALLDPQARTVAASMIANGDVDNFVAGRPFNYADGDAMKILVVMTDGAHTSQYYMNNYRSGYSFVWRTVAGDDTHYYIWSDGEGSTPDLDPPTNQTEWVCTYSRNGYCYNWEQQPIKYWFDAYNTNTDGSGSTQYQWVTKPPAGAERLTWAQVWNDIPPEYFSDEILYEMGTLNDTERNAYEYAMRSVGSSTKNARFDAICQAVKDNNVIVFSIGLEVTSSNAARLQDCASSPSHYYDVDNLDISYAFKSIASQINQLRLTQ